MDPFNNAGNKRVTPRCSVSSEPPVSKNAPFVGPSIPELLECTQYPVEFGAFCENLEFSVILKDRNNIYKALQDDLNAFCAKKEPITDLHNLNALYAVKLPRGEWVRAVIVECLTSSDAEMELIDFSSQLRRCHLDQIVQIFGR